MKCCKCCCYKNGYKDGFKDAKEKAANIAWDTTGRGNPKNITFSEGSTELGNVIQAMEEKDE